jgi:hypothetical protein
VSDENPERWCVVTDIHRGVVFGRLTDWDPVLRIATLANCRHCYYWPANPKAMGLFGLASHGPVKDGAKISEPVDLCQVMDVAKIIDCSAPAVKAFAKVKW